MSAINILVVEDEAITAEVIAEQLQQLGYGVVETVASGSAAISSVAKNRPDLVLMDIVLKRGDIDGITAADRIRQDFKIPVIYLTAHSDKATLDRAKVTEPFGYIVKPFNERDLRVAIEMAIHKYQSEQQLHQREDLLSAILENTSDGIISTDDKARITYMNAGAQKLTGWSLAEAEGKNIKEIVKLIDLQTKDDVKHPIDRVFEEKTVIYQEREVNLIRQDGSQIPVSYSGSLIAETNGETIGGVIVLWSINESKTTEVTTIKNPKVTPSKPQTPASHPTEQELSELKSRLISTISHEFRTPLMVVLSSAGLLRRYNSTTLQEKKDKHLDRIQNAVEQMTRLVEDIVTFSKAEEGEFTFEPTQVNLETLCHKLVQERQAKATKKHRFHFIYKGNQSVYVDAQLLRLIIEHLLENAVKYSPNGGNIFLEVCCTNRVILSITDEGIGIPLAEQNRLFERFYRASNTGTIGGTGMGLAIVKKCVDIHGGQLLLSSEVGAGTTFTVTLPLVA